LKKGVKKRIHLCTLRKTRQRKGGKRLPFGRNRIGRKGINDDGKLRKGELFSTARVGEGTGRGACFFSETRKRGVGGGG